VCDHKIPFFRGGGELACEHAATANISLLSALLLFHLNIPEEQQGEGTEGGTH